MWRACLQEQHVSCLLGDLSQLGTDGLQHPVLCIRSAIGLDNCLTNLGSAGGALVLHLIRCHLLHRRSQWLKFEALHCLWTLSSRRWQVVLLKYY